MYRKALKILSAVAFFSPAAALAQAPASPQVIYAADNLAHTAQQFADTMRTQGQDQHAALDAGTVYDASEHFDEEARLGPQDLDVDYQNLQQAFQTLAQDVQADGNITRNQQTAYLWYQLEQANAGLQQAWATPYPPPPPPPPRVQQTMVECDSDHYSFERCLVPGRVLNAVLIRQSSFMPCNLGNSWGYDNVGLWVSGGCRGQFQVTYQ